MKTSQSCCSFCDDKQAVFFGDAIKTSHGWSVIKKSITLTIRYEVKTILWCHQRTFYVCSFNSLPIFWQSWWFIFLVTSTTISLDTQTNACIYIICNYLYHSKVNKILFYLCFPIHVIICMDILLYILIISDKQLCFPIHVSMSSN